jgi:hypothetical protein
LTAEDARVTIDGGLDRQMTQSAAGPHQMGAKPATPEKVELELRCLELMLTDLPEIAEEWDTIGDGERVSWSRDWDQLMGALEAILYPTYQSGSMTDEQRVRYRQILCTLQASLSTLRRVGLREPTVPLDC